MIIVLKKETTAEELKELEQMLQKKGLKTHVSKGTERTIVGILGDERLLEKDRIEGLHYVEKVMPVLKPYKLASREFHPENSIVKVNGLEIGKEEVTIMAGPCAVESEEQLLETAHAVKEAGAKVLRASAYKPRTSPYSFQGLGEEGLKILKKAKKETGLVIETEVMDIRNVGLCAKYVDILRIGARNMQNFDLLREVGKINKPVILKNGISSTMEEFLMSAEYILSEGNKNVILCLRGVRTFEPAIRFPLDVSLIPLLKGTTHLPIIVDPSHATGKKELVGPLAKAAIAAGADGLLIEVHRNPEEALSDAKQQLTPEEFKKLVNELKKVAEAVGRKV